MNRTMQRRQAVADLLLILVALLIVWQLLFLIAGSTTLASPIAALRMTVELLISADFWSNVAGTLRAFGLATMIVVALGIVLGLSLGFSRLLGDAYEPMLMSLYTVPKVAFFPVILLVFGIGLSAEVAFGVVHGVVPVAIFTINAVRNIRPVYVRAARAMGLSLGQTVVFVLLPAVAPEVFTGVRMGVSLTFIGVILSEMFGSHEGIGFLLMQAIGLGNGSTIMALTVLIVAFALGLNALLSMLSRRIDHQTSLRQRME